MLHFFFSMYHFCGNVWHVAGIISFDDWQPSIRTKTSKDSYNHLYHIGLAKPFFPKNASNSTFFQ